MVRFGTPTGLTIRVATTPGQERMAVTLPGDIVKKYGLQSVFPQPLEWEAGESGIRMVFPVQPGAHEAVIQVGGMPAGGGLMHLSAQLDDSPAVGWSQLVLP